ncbi:MAG: hypothetical protein ACXWW7_14330, partial [Nocardioides sp.]
MTTHAPEAPSATLADVVADARAAVADLASALWAAKPAEELLATNQELERLRSTLASIQAIAAVQIDETDAARTEAWASTRDYLTATAGGRRAHGNRLLRTAEAIVDQHPATWQALHEATIS